MVFSLPPSCVLQHPDSKMMQINLTGFLNGKNAREFMRDLWPLLLSAQENIAGIPSAFLEQKKEEIKQRQVSVSLKVHLAKCCCQKVMALWLLTVQVAQAEKDGNK